MSILSDFYGTATAPIEGYLQFTDDSVFPLRCRTKSFRIKYGSYNYSGAVKECAKSGGRLVTMQNEEASSCVKKAIRDVGLGAFRFWMGLTRIGLGINDFVWSDGKIMEANDFKDWGEDSFLIFDCLRHEKLFPTSYRE